MEFGLITMAQKDFIMFLPCILVISSVASFRLSILYDKVRVKNIRGGILRDGNIFGKTGIVMIFIERIIEEDIPENACMVHSFINLICTVFVVFHSLRLMCRQHSHKNLKWWPVWDTVSDSTHAHTNGEFSEGLSRVHHPLACALGWLFRGGWRGFQGRRTWSMTSLYLGHVDVSGSVESFTRPARVNETFVLPGKLVFLCYKISKCIGWQNMF